MVKSCPADSLLKKKKKIVGGENPKGPYYATHSFLSAHV